MDFNDISVLGVELWNTLDGGDVERMGPEWWTYEVHADKHDLQWVGPNELILPRMEARTEAPTTATRGRTSSTFPWILPRHHIPWAPGWYTAGAQDNGTTTGNASVAMNGAATVGETVSPHCTIPRTPPSRGDGAVRQLRVQLDGMGPGTGVEQLHGRYRSGGPGPWDAPICFIPPTLMSGAARNASTG